jgi:benzodiazapine receptor
MNSDSIKAYVFSFAVLTIVMLLPSEISNKHQTRSSWYACIKPSISPPNYVFPIVWTILYTLIAIFMAECIRRPVMIREKKIILWILGINLVLNVLWSFLYFKHKEILLALFCLLGILITTGILIYYAWTIYPAWISYLLVPYCMWLCFAFVLNIMSVYNARKCVALL